MALPEDLVTVGYVSGAYGIQGWIRIKPYSADAQALLAARTWWLDKPEARDVDVREAKLHGDEVVALLMGVAGRDGAEALKGATVQVRRSHFPPLEDDEFYWVDLIGLAVENVRGVSLGVVAGLIDNGAHPILRVVPVAPPELQGQHEQQEQQEQDKQGKAELLVPFVDRFVHAVDQAAKKITVDWEAEY
jgi:16S rRNA processing protein RimM